MLINGKSLDAICSLTPYPIDEFIHVSAEVLSLADPEITVRFDNHEDGTSDLYLALTNPIEEIDVTSVKNAILKKYDDKLKKVSVYQIPKNPVNSYESWMKNGKIFHEMHHAKVHEAPLLFEVTGKAQKNYDFTTEMQSAYQPISDPTDQIRREEKQRVNNFKFFRKGDRLLDKPLYFHSKMHVWQVVARVREYIDAGFNPVFIEVDPKTKAAKPNEEQRFLKEYKSMALFEKLMNNREFKRTHVKKEKHFDRDYPGEIFSAKNPNIKVSEKKNKKQKTENAKVEEAKVEKVDNTKVNEAKTEEAKVDNVEVTEEGYPIIDGVPLLGNSENARILHDALVEKKKKETAEKLKEQNKEKHKEKTEEPKNEISEIELDGKKVKVEDYHGTKFNLETGKPIFFEFEPKYDTSKLDPEIVQKAKATECYVDKYCKVVYAGGIKMKPYGIKPSDFELLAAQINGTCEKLLPQKVKKNNSFNLNSGNLEELAVIADYAGIPKSRLIDKAIESTTDKRPILSNQYEKHLLDSMVKDSFKNAQVDYIKEQKLLSIQTNELSVTGDNDLSYSEKCRIVASFRPAIENILVIYGDSKKFSKVTVEEALAYEAEHKSEQNNQQPKIPYFDEEQIKNEMPLTDEEQNNFEQIKKEQNKLLMPESLIRYQETFDTLSGVEGTKIKFVNKALVLLVPDNKLEQANAEPDSSIADGSIINYVITRAYPTEQGKIKETNTEQVVEQMPQIDLDKVKEQAAQITLNTGLTLDKALISLNEKMSQAYGVPVACQIKGDKFVVNLAKKDADKADPKLLEQFEDEIFKTLKSVGVSGVTSVTYRTDFETVERINYTKDDLDNVRNLVQKIVNGKFAALNYIDIDPRFGGAIMIQSPTMGDTFFELGRKWFDENTSNLITLALSSMNEPKPIYELIVVNSSQKAIYRRQFNIKEVNTIAVNKIQKQLKTDNEKADVNKQSKDYKTNEDGVSVVNENFFNLGNDDI